MSSTFLRRGAVLVAVTALALAGCSDDSTSSAADTPTPGATTTTAAAPSPEDIASLGAVTVSGPAGTEPTVTFDKPFTVSALTTRIVADGDGAVIEHGQQISMHSAAYSGADASKLGSTWTSDSPESFTIDDSIASEFRALIVGQKVGVRFLIAQPTTDQTTGQPITYVSLAEVTDARTIPARAEGESVTPAEGLPTVTLDGNGKPDISIPEGYKAPDELVVQTLIKGTGPVVTADQSVTAHYTGKLLDGTVFDSSWEGGSPLSFSLQGVIKGWTQGLAGQTVGSQVLLVIPADLGYGDAAQGKIPANSPLVFVVDILDAR